MEKIRLKLSGSGRDKKEADFSDAFNKVFMWKHVKSRLRSKYYDQFDEFTKVICSIIEDTGSKGIVDRLIGDSVQIFDLQPSNEMLLYLTKIERRVPFKSYRSLV